jgi:hypothetical protein
VCRECAREGANGRNARNNSTHFTFAAKAATIQAYVREAIAVEKAGLRMKPKKTSDFPVPDDDIPTPRNDVPFHIGFAKRS